MNWLLVSLSVGLGVMSMLSKEQGITSLALCLLYDFFIFNKVRVSLLYYQYSGTSLTYTSWLQYLIIEYTSQYNYIHPLGTQQENCIREVHGLIIIQPMWL